MYNIAVIGDRDSIYGFAALGLSTFPVQNAEEGAKTLRKLCESNYAIIYITEALADQLEEEIDKYRENAIACHYPDTGCIGQYGQGYSKR